jgi:hypothetical protein
MKLTVVERLGNGGFGNVDLVTDEAGRKFARKTFSVNQPLPEELVPNVQKRFVREAELQLGMSHRNIVPITYAELDSDFPWYLMPVADSTLEKDIAQDKTLGGNFKVALADVIAGLEELHSMQMYHRDLKPQNVLRFTDPSSGQPFYAISDFGFVSLKDSRLSKLTVTGMAKGTDYYTPPEMTKNLSSASPQSDIYSLGCIIHDMVGIEDRVPCGEIHEDTEFGPLLLSCTRAKPARRFKSVSAVRDVLVSIDASVPKPATKEAVSFADKLDEGGLTRSEVTALAEFLEDNSESTDAVVLLRKLSIERINEAKAENPEDTKRIGMVFAEWVGSNAFDFDYCDVLANRLSAFMEGAPYDLQAECLIAMLRLGTSHNRWYVERRFVSGVGPQMEEGLAKRLAVEFRATGKAICDQIDHLERSISASRQSLHPVLVKALEETCK